MGSGDVIANEGAAKLVIEFAYAPRSIGNFLRHAGYVQA
jgi:hypothetical protein